MAFENDNQRLKDVLRQWTEAVRDELYEAYRDAGYLPSSDLLSLLDCGVREDGDDLQAYLVLADYWPYIEHGRAPGKFPPPDAIAGWIRERNIIPRPYTLPNGRERIPTENQLAFLIGRKIAQEGIKPRPLLSKTLVKMQNELQDELQEAFSEHLRNEISKALA